VPANPQESAPGVPSPGTPPWARQIAALLGFLALSWVVATLGSVPIILNSNGWYALAEKAPWTPPGWLFGSAWTALYAAMAVAAWLVWRQRAFPRRDALTVYAVLIVLNLAWPMMFFGMYPMMGTAALWLALLIITAHAATATVTVLRFGPISTSAGLLMLPYVSWLVFSASLNVYAALSN
jgi:tryptophan-rich sensory protein